MEDEIEFWKRHIEVLHRSLKHVDEDLTKAGAL
jgi:hypothetical protein